MTVGTNSYGTAADVAAMTARYTSSGAFVDGTTRPTLTQVETWIDNASATLNVMLAKAGFSIPIIQTSAKAACAQIVVETVAELVHYANSAGRFYTERALERGVAPMRVLRQEMADWVESMAPGLEALGATRTQSFLEGILFKEFDGQGDSVEPIFQRNGFGNDFDDIGAGDPD
jgi:hypothetical protein